MNENRQIAKDYQGIQVSGKDEKGRDVLSVLVKKSYRLSDDGRCLDDIPTQPFVQELEYYPETDKLLRQDFEVYPIKMKTDVVIQGYAQTNNAQRQFTVSVRMGKINNSIAVIGDRKATLSTSGKVHFSNPEIIERIPLRYDFAYGGWDKVGEYNLETHRKEKAAEMAKVVDWESGSAYRYPRNPMGKGFLVDLSKEGVEQLDLPNLEDPLDRLKEDKLSCKEYRSWTEMPIPRCTDWIDLGCFPRLALFGLPMRKVNATEMIEEVKRNWLPQDILVNKAPRKKFNMQAMNGASMGFQLDYLLGNEECHLTNIHPRKANFKFKLPGKTPRIWVDGRKGNLTSTKPVLHCVLVKPEEDEVTLIWRGSAKALRPYLDEELLNMPFKIEWQ